MYSQGTEVDEGCDGTLMRVCDGTLKRVCDGTLMRACDGTLMWVCDGTLHQEPNLVEKLLTCSLPPKKKHPFD